VSERINNIPSKKIKESDTNQGPRTRENEGMTEKLKL